jgi:hypothetical protein
MAGAKKMSKVKAMGRQGKVIQSLDRSKNVQIG